MEVEINYNVEPVSSIKLNKLSPNELIKQIAALKKPETVGEKTEFYLSGHTFVCESDLKINCFKLEWKIIDIKGNINPIQ